MTVILPSLWRSRISRYLTAMRLLDYSEKSPAERLVLSVVFSQRERCNRFGHFIPQVEGVRRIDLFDLPHLFEQREGIFALEVHFVVDDVEQALFSKEAEIAIFDL